VPHLGNSKHQPCVEGSSADVGIAPPLDAFNQEKLMLRATLLASSAVACLMLAACGQQGNQAQQQATADQQAEIASKPAPNAAERTAAEAANEVEQAAAPDAQITPAELAAGISAEDVPNPQTALSTAAVRTSSGQALGEVRSVTVGTDGKADAVVIEVGGFLNVGEHPVSIEAKKFTYLKDRNILVAAVTKSDVEKMPVAKSQ
jgi:cytoskeletal protein RodZ